jgi:hypothetical protein
MYSNRDLVFVPLNRFYQGVIGCQEDRTRKSRAGKVKGIKRFQTTRLFANWSRLSAFSIRSQSEIREIYDSIASLPTSSQSFMHRLRISVTASVSMRIR